MTPKERELILSVAARLRNANLTEKDPEAEALIRQEVGSHPDAVYLLTQAVILQEYGLDQAQQRIAGLEKALQQARRQAAAPAPKQASSFLGGMFGGSQKGATAPPAAGKAQAGGATAAPSRPVPGMAGPSGPVPGAAQMAAGAGGRPGPGQTAAQAGPAAGAAPAGGGFGGFMRSAAAMAVGVAGGQLLFSGLSNMFGGDEAAATQADAAGAEAAGGEAGSDSAAETDPALAGEPTPSGEETTADAGGDDAGGGWSVNEDTAAGADPDEFDLPPEEPPAEYADAFETDPFAEEGGFDLDPSPTEEDTDFGGGFDDGGDFGGDDDSWG